MALIASGVALNPTLSANLGGLGTTSSNAIASNFNAAKKRISGDAQARGMNGAAATGPNSYAGDQLTRGQGIAQDNLASALGGGLGNTAYQDTLAQRDFGQQESLANQVGNLNSLSTLQQVLGGLGAAGSAGATAYGAYGKFNKPKTTNPLLDDSFGDTGGGGAYDINNPGPLDLGYGGYH